MEKKIKEIFRISEYYLRLTLTIKKLLLSKYTELNVIH